jgi:tRNA1(Val) A37 N6-methylase TrmN6
MKIYNDNFYLDNRTRIKSAEKLLSHLFIYFQPKSLVDVGCGRGAWLKVAQNLGVNKLLGIDGQWNKDKLILKNTKKSKVNFIYKDLNHFFKIVATKLNIVTIHFKNWAQLKKFQNF